MFQALGRDEAAFAAATRYFGENLRRIAGSQVEFFRATVLEPTFASAGPSQQAIEFVGGVAGVLRPAAEALIRWLHARHFEASLMQTLVQVVESTMEAAGYRPERTTAPPGIGFLDISGFTRLTEDAGDEAAAQLAARLSELVGEISIAHGCRAVKFLGDGVMFYFPDPSRAPLCGLELVERASEAGLPAARVGVTVGPVVFRDGDYFGRTVNIAARVTDYARPGEVLVTDSLTSAVPAGGPARFEPIGPVTLKGLPEPMVVSRVVRSG